MGRKVDLTGQRFGNLVVIRDAGRKNGYVLWECLCDCGKHINTTSDNLRSENTKSCGCSQIRDLSGLRFGKLVVLNCTNKRSQRSVIWRCKCDCGEYKEVSSKDLSCGGVKSCGCLVSESLEGKRYGNLLVTERTNERRNGKVLWKCLCDCGNYKNVSSAHLNLGSVRSCGCKQHRYGTDHHRYNPDLTDEERINGRGHEQTVWSQRVLYSDNYTCQVCGDNTGGNLNAHHLNGWNAFPEQRFDLDNGVTLCTDCHKDFHSQYGYGDNTREQFNEYAASKTLILN